MIVFLLAFMLLSLFLSILDLCFSLYYRHEYLRRNRIPPTRKHLLATNNVTLLVILHAKPVHQIRGLIKLNCIIIYSTGLHASCAPGLRGR